MFNYVGVVVINFLAKRYFNRIDAFVFMGCGALLYAEQYWWWLATWLIGTLVSVVFERASNL